MHILNVNRFSSEKGFPSHSIAAAEGIMKSSSDWIRKELSSYFWVMFVVRWLLLGHIERELNVKNRKDS